MNPQILSSLAIIGIIVSLLSQWVKQYLDTLKTQVLVVGLAIVAGIIYFFLQTHTNIIVNILAILATADTVYSYLLQYFEKPTIQPSVPVPANPTTPTTPSV